MAGVIGAQQPRILSVPEYIESTGLEAVELAALADIDLDPWQELLLEHALGEREDGSWAAFEVAVQVSRQNGKGGLLEAREIAGLFLLEERLIVHSAHEFSTAEEALNRMATIVEGCPDFDRRVMSIKRSHGQEGIYLRGRGRGTIGSRLRYRTRTKGGGRGLSADLVVLDEAMHIPEAMLNALMPVLSARENPQLWYTGSAVDQEIMDNGVVFARVRERGIAGDDPRLMYAEWSPDVDHPGAVTTEMAQDPEVWAQSNPALGIRISAEHITAEQRSMSPRGFAVERLGVGDWPATSAEADRKIDPDAWARCVDPRSRLEDPVCLAWDTTPDRSMSAIAAAGFRADGLIGVEVIEHRTGTGWVARRVAQLVERHVPRGVVWAKGSPAASLVDAVEQELEDAGLDLETTPAGVDASASACGQLVDAVTDGRLRHRGSTELSVAVQGAVARKSGDAWLWSRPSSLVDISPLVAVTLAVWGLGSIKADARKMPPVSAFRIRRL